MTNDKSDIGSWVRYFRLAKTIQTLDVMRDRCSERAPDSSVMIKVAANHRQDEILAGRLMEVSSGR